MQDTAQRIVNPTNDWNWESKSHLQYGIHTVESGTHAVACEQALLFGQAHRGFPACSRVLARLVSLAQIGELARRLPTPWNQKSGTWPGSFRSILFVYRIIK